MQSIFADVPEVSTKEHFLTLFESPTVKIERIVSQSHSTPAGVWYDQDQEEWVIVLRGQATLQFEHGEPVQMKAGDYVTIPTHLRHRVEETNPDTIWLVVHVRKEN